MENKLIDNIIKIYESQHENLHTMFLGNSSYTLQCKKKEKKKHMRHEIT